MYQSEVLMKKHLCLLLSLFLALPLFCSCEKNVYPLSSTEFMMDTVITITVYDGEADALDGAIKLCKQYENLFSRTVETSDIAKINNSNGTPVTVNPETAELLKIALDVAEKSDGAFDPTVLPLVELWNVTKNTTPPEQDKITEGLKSVGYKNIHLDGNTVTAKNGVKLDLGGIAKGYITDKVVEHLKQKKVTSAIINLGGNLYLLGDKKGEPFSVGIQKPFGKQDEHSAVLMLENKTAVTSGVYQRYFKHNGQLYHHIIDPKTGHPADNGLYAVTVIADSSSLADGLSTACLLLGTEKAIALATKYDAELIIITSDHQLITTNGINRNTKKGETVLNLK